MGRPRIGATVFAPSSIAVVGASERPGSWAGNVHRNLLKFGFRGRIVPVNPGRAEVWGLPALASLRDAHEQIDHAVVVVPREQVSGILEDAAAAGIEAATIITSGFADDATAAGREAQASLEAVVRRTGIRVVGPNSFGWIAPAAACVPMAYPQMPSLVEGGFAFLSQSGGAIPLVIDAARERGRGTRLAVSVGNGLDLGFADLLEYLSGDPETTTIGMLIEGVADWDAVLAGTSKAVSQGKQVIAVKVGRSSGGQAASVSHTGTLAGDHRVFGAHFMAVGGIVASSLDELVDLVDLTTVAPFPAGRRVNVMVTSGNLRAMVFDAAEEARIELPQLPTSTAESLRAVVGPDGAVGNPVDAGYAALQSEPVYRQVVDALVAHQGVDATLVFGKLEERFRTRYEAAADVAREAGRPLVLFGRVTQSLTHEAQALKQLLGIPFLPTLERAVRAIDLIATAMEAPRSCRSEADESVRLAAGRLREWSLRGSSIPESEALEILSQAGLAIVRTQLVATPEEAETAADALGMPVAIKVVSPDLHHKTEVGGVVLGLATGTSVRDAAATLLSKAAELGIRAPRLVVQPMADGHEMLVGSVSIAGFGPTVIVGTGGVRVEALNDVALAPAPVDRTTAEKMIEATSVGRVLARLGSGRDAALSHAVDYVSRFSQLVALVDDVRPEIDINPVFVSAERAVAVDALIAFPTVVVESRESMHV